MRQKTFLTFENSYSKEVFLFFFLSIRMVREMALLGEWRGLASQFVKVQFNPFAMELIFIGVSSKVQILNLGKTIFYCCGQMLINALKGNIKLGDNC